MIDQKRGKGSEEAMLDKIEAISMQARVYQRLKKALISGFFEPGQILVIRELAEQLGTSPMPIRQSVSRLVSEHALEEGDKPRSSVRVPKLSADVFEDIRGARVLVESEAAARAAERITKDGIAQLRRLNAAIDGAVADGDITSTITANCDFHFAIYRSADSVTLLRMIESLWLQSGPYFRVLVRRYFDEGAPEKGAVNAHNSLLQAMIDRDGAAARVAMADDINRAAAHFLAMSESDRERPGRRARPTRKLALV
jgi:DNA-binding GntR family transcriptional regulator